MAYQYHEYPKWVHPEGKPSVIVHSLEEEATALAGEKVVRDAEERARLVKVAEVKGVAVDGRWGLERIATAIRDAGFDPDLNPFA